MTYFGKAMKVLFYPMRLITVPLAWLFKHRCELDKEGACKGLFCETGKVGVPGWSNHYRAGEWVYHKPFNAASLGLKMPAVTTKAPIYINTNASPLHAQIAVELKDRGLTVIHKE